MTVTATRPTLELLSDSFDIPFFDEPKKQFCKVYNDGGHYIAVPHVSQRVSKKKAKEEVQEIFDNLYAMAIKNGKNERETKNFLFDNLCVFFENDEETEIFIKEQIKRKAFNLYQRKKRFKRKAYLNAWTHFITITYSDKMLNEEDFRKKIAAEADNCALSVSINTGDYEDIHPSDKRVIASQACDKYIEVFYGSTQLLSGPTFSRSERDGKYVILYFDNVGDGLPVKNGGCNFQVSQDGNKWYEVYAEKDGKASVMLSAKNTPITTINYVRYGALNYPRVFRLDMSEYVSLFNSKDYPCDQFEIKVN